MKRKRFICFFLIAVFLAAVDQLIKYFVVKYIPYQTDKKVFGNAFVLTYIRNDGTAWGALSGKMVFLIVMTIVITVVTLYVFYHAASYKRYKAVRISLAFLMGGAMGNLIDRLRLHYVVDYLYFKLIHFPVFNFADICVTCSLILLLALMIFYYDSRDYDVLIGDMVIREDGTYEEKPHGRKK